MSYKVISTLVTADSANTTAAEAAISLADRTGAHLDFFALGLERTEANFYYAGAEAVVMAENAKHAKEDRDAAEAWVANRMRGEIIPFTCFPAIVPNSALQRFLALRLRFTDLVVLPQPSGGATSRQDSIILEACLFEAERPALIIPDSVAGPKPGGRIVLGWNEGAEAMSALRAALPFLQQARQVDICIIDPPKHGENRSDPGGLVAEYLVRHGVKAQVDVLAKTESNIGAILIRKAQEIGAEMIVTGAYGHSRLREAVFGGTSRELIENCPLPLFMAR
ncbi:Universal stress protein family protein [Cognatiyoonia koreensis]|uniref:Universal stress protein family protein n=1 Tax=Cognatiyoonia koreensis TaxID=364200 RepID=A0A1I0RPA7_9RHOB|nr:universal stress protein [Cognatiyoonia koreensis]SEW43061.1 Universal stress protein family protein [Cognatiyoonia koreensis]